MPFCSQYCNMLSLLLVRNYGTCGNVEIIKLVACQVASCSAIINLNPTWRQNVCITNTKRCMPQRHSSQPVHVASLILSKKLDFIAE